MPIYEYYCSSCSRRFDLLRPVSRIDDEEYCLKCNVVAKRVVSVFTSISTTTGGYTDSPAGGGCCGGGGGCACSMSA